MTAGVVSAGLLLTADPTTAIEQSKSPDQCDKKCETNRLRKRLHRRHTPHGAWAIPSYIVMCESGGSRTADNPSSTASGAYQDLDSTWNAYRERVPKRTKRQLRRVGAPIKSAPAARSALLAQHVVNFYVSSGGRAFSQWSCA